MGCISWIMKNLIFLFNLVFVLIGLVLIVVGVLFKLDFDDVTEHLDNTAFQTSTNLLIAIGVIIFVIAFFGCCGAIKKNSCMITTYGVILILLFILQVTAGILAFMAVQDDDKNFKDDLKRDLQKLFNKNDDASKEAFNLIEKTVKCCGINGPHDYITKPPIPDSCYGSSKTELYTDGCSDKLFKYIDENLEIVGYVALGLCAVEVVGAIISFCLASTFRKESRRGY